MIKATKILQPSTNDYTDYGKYKLIEKEKKTVKKWNHMLYKVYVLLHPAKYLSKLDIYFISYSTSLEPTRY